MAEARFADIMQQERERLHKERDTIFSQQRELEKKLVQIDRELAAIDAYEAAKSGKLAMPARQGRGSRGRRQARRGSKREALLVLIKANPGGLSRRQILEHMALKGDKSGEMSVSNALTSLIKNHQLARRDGKYVSGG